MRQPDVELSQFDRCGSFFWRRLVRGRVLHSRAPAFLERSVSSIVATALLGVYIVQMISGVCWSQELVLRTNRIEGAQLKGLESDSAVFQTGKGELRVPMAEIIYWGSLCEPTSHEWLCLRNGSLIAGECLDFDKDHLTWHNDSLGDFQMPVSRVTGMVFQLPGLIPEKDLLLDKISQGSPTGFVLLANGDQLDGQLLRREKNGDLVVVTRFGERAFGPEQLRAVSFPGGPIVEKQPIQFAVGLKDGSRIMITKPGKNPAGRAAPSLETTPVKDEEEDVIWELIKTHSQRVCFLQVLEGVVYLSDLKPQDFIAVPFLDYVRGFRGDRNVMGGWLRAGDRGYLKGLGTYSACRIRYALDGQFSQFAAEVAIDACANRKGSVICHVLVDGQRKMSVGPIRGGDRPVPIVVDVSGAGDLDLVVDFGEWADECDYANWLNARLIPMAKANIQLRPSN